MLFLIDDVKQLAHGKRCQLFLCDVRRAYDACLGERYRIERCDLDAATYLVKFHDESFPLSFHSRVAAAIFRVSTA